MKAVENPSSSTVKSITDLELILVMKNEGPYNCDFWFTLK